MTNDLEIEQQQGEQEPRIGIKTFEKGIIKKIPFDRTGGVEVWESPEIEIKSLGKIRVRTYTPRTKQALEANPVWKENQNVYVVDDNGEISFGRAREFMENYGFLWVGLNSPDPIWQGLQDRDAFRKGNVPQVNVDCLVWFSEDSKFRGKLVGILPVGATLKFGLEDSGEKDRPILIAPSESLLKKLNISFETYTEPQGGGN